MKKILLAADESLLTTNLLESAIKLTKELDAVLTGVFVKDLSVVDYYTILGGNPVYYEHTYEIIKEELSEAEKQAISLIDHFVEVCKNENIKFKVHFDKGIPIEELVEESHFADLMILGYKSYFSYQASDQDLVRKVLSRSECPVILMPDETESIRELVFAYDGTDSSMKAISAACNLFENAIMPLKCNIVHVRKSEDDLTEIDPRFVEWMQLKFEVVNTHYLIGDPKDEIIYFMHQIPTGLLVMGAYGHSGITRFFSGSTTDAILRSSIIKTLLWH